MFRVPIEKNLVEDILQQLNFLGLHDKKEFTKYDISKEKFEDIVFVIEPYYLPCKAKRFLHDLNEGKQITILRHLLRSIGYDLLVQEKVLHSTKSTTYQIYQKYLSTDSHVNYTIDFP